MTEWRVRQRARAEKLELDGADADSVPGDQLGLVEGAAIQSCVGREAANHRARGAAEDQAVKGLHSTDAKSQGAAGPRPDRALYGFEPNELTVTGRAANLEHQFAVGDIQDGRSGNTNHDHPPEEDRIDNDTPLQRWGGGGSKGISDAKPT